MQQYWCKKSYSKAETYFLRNTWTRMMNVCWINIISFVWLFVVPWLILGPIPFFKSKDNYLFKFLSWATQYTTSKTFVFFFFIFQPSTSSAGLSIPGGTRVSTNVSFGIVCEMGKNPQLDADLEWFFVRRIVCDAKINKSINIKLLIQKIKKYSIHERWEYIVVDTNELINRSFFF